MEEALISLGWIKDEIQSILLSTINKTSKRIYYHNYYITIPNIRESGEYFTPDKYEILDCDRFCLSFLEEINIQHCYCKYNMLISNPYGDFIFKGIIETKEELEVLMKQLGIKSNYNI